MAQRVVIIDYGSGNLRSVQKSLERAARETGTPARVDLANRPDKIAAADRIVLPGVGAFAACRAGLAAEDGVLEALEHAVLVEAKPFLGVCVGMQLLADRGEEFGDHRGLGWIAGVVSPFPEDPALRVPHMGWNSVRAEGCALFAGVEAEDFYFAHSYYFAPENDQSIMAVCRYGRDFAAGVARDNIAGVQFHPEKSQRAGLVLFENFLRWDPS